MRLLSFYKKIVRYPHLRNFLVLLALSPITYCITACSPTTYGKGESVREPLLNYKEFVTADDMVLPLKMWQQSEQNKPEALIVALHGFNDYANAFASPGQYLAEHYNITTYAYDQRGFGEAGKRGTWAGTETYVQDLQAFCLEIRQKYPGVPLYVMGESMGGAITMTAFTSEYRPDADGIILIAPAVWARKTMPWYQRSALFVGAHLFPWMSLTGDGIVKVTPSDNREMLIALGQDPLVIKDTKVAAMYGLTNLMDQALESSSKLNVPALVMIADKDDIVPNRPSALMVDQFSKTEAETEREKQIVVYKNGYHMLLRDLQAELVWQDIAAWIKSPDQGLPSATGKIEVQTDLNSWMEENFN